MTQPDNKTAAAERVSDEWILDELSYSDRDGCNCEYCRCLRELIAQRAAAKYRQHLPGCIVGTIIRIHGGKASKDFGDDQCTCGYAQLPQHIRGET